MLLRQVVPLALDGRGFAGAVGFALGSTSETQEAAAP